MDELRSCEATRQGSSPHSTSSLKGMRGKRGGSQSQDPGLGLPADRSPWSRRLGRRTLGQAYPGHQGQPSSLPPALRLASAPSSRRGQTGAATGHLRFEGDMGRDYPEVSGSREGCAAGRASQPSCLHRLRWPNSRLQRDLTKLDNPKGRVPHLALPAGSCPYPHPHPLPLYLSLSPSFPLCFCLSMGCVSLFSTLTNAT